MVLHGIPLHTPALAALAWERKGCLGTLWKGCHGTGHKTGSDGPPSCQTCQKLLCATLVFNESAGSMLTDRGSSVQTAALGSSLVGGALLIGRLGSGYLLDRFFGPRIAAIFLGVAVGIGLLWISSRELVFAAAFLIGLGMGAAADIIAYLNSRYFGLRAFGEIYGYAFAAFVPAGGLGPLIMGSGFERPGSYAVTLAGFFTATLVAVALMTRLGPYRYRARRPERSERLSHFQANRA